MSYIVNKFGGDITSDPKYLGIAADIISHQRQMGDRPVAVLSAFRDVTDQFQGLFRYLKTMKKKEAETVLGHVGKTIEGIKDRHYQLIDAMLESSESRMLAKKSVKELARQAYSDLAGAFRTGDYSMRMQDMAVHHGDRLPSPVLREALKARGIKVYTPRETAVLTDGRFGEAGILLDKTLEALDCYIEELDKGSVIIEDGYFGRDTKGNITVFERGGSDYKAVGLSIVLDAPVYLWKSTQGVMSADPKLVDNVRHVPRLDYGEAVEAGKILQPNAVALASENKKILIVANLETRRKNKTVIDRDGDPSHKVKIISASKDEYLFDIASPSMVYAGTFPYDAFRERGINISTINSDMRGRAFLTCRAKNNSRLETQATLKETAREIEKIGYEIDYSPINLVYVIGRIDWDTVDRVNEIAKAFGAKMGSPPSHVNVPSVAVKTTGDTDDLVRKLHKELVEKA